MAMTRRVEAAGAARRIAEQLLALRAGGRPGSPARSAAASSPAPAPVRPSRQPLDYPRLQRHMRWFDGVLRLYRAAAHAVAEQLALAGPDDAVRPADAASDPGGDAEAEQLIAFARRAHRILLEHPVAAKAAYAALAAQGRAFAATREGGELRARLVRSRRLRRASLVWRSLTMGMLDDQDPGELPATYLDNLLRAIDRSDLEQLLGRLQPRREAP
jgi:hypothetical protein